MGPPRRRPLWARLLGSLGAGLGSAVLVAMALTVVDLYQAGHGQLLLSRPWLDSEPRSLGVVPRRRRLCSCWAWALDLFCDRVPGEACRNRAAFRVASKHPRNSPFVGPTTAISWPA
jgi:hypothetical protein